jgi:hypothetical protein
MTYLEVAIAEAERFLERAKALQEWRKSNIQNKHMFSYEADYRRLNASMKRSSLDLSKALPVLRKSRWE